MVPQLFGPPSGGVGNETRPCVPLSIDAAQERAAECTVSLTGTRYAEHRNPTFLEKRRDCVKSVLKPSKFAHSSHSQHSIGLIITKDKLGVFYTTQVDNINKLTIASTQVEFASQGAPAQYVSVNTRPEVCSPTQLIEPVNQPMTSE